MVIKSRFPDVVGILEAIDADVAGAERWGQSENRLPPEVLDHERKYEANGSNKPVCNRRLAFQSLVQSLSQGARREFDVISGEVFAGVDEGFEFADASGENVILHRLRFGSNRPCQWTTKRRISGTEGTERYRTSISILYRDFPKVRAGLILTARTAGRSRHAIVGQSGEFWFVKDRATDYVVEIALYKAGRAEPDAKSPIKLLAEIAPRNCPNAEAAVTIITRYEKLLHLRGKRIRESNMELFADEC